MSVTLTFLGGAREVTGSCMLVQTARKLNSPLAP